MMPYLFKGSLYAFIVMIEFIDEVYLFVILSLAKYLFLSVDEDNEFLIIIFVRKLR